MSNNKQSSVRWAIEELVRFELKTSEFFFKTEIINHADRLHKEEMMDFAFQVGRGQDYDDEEVRELAKIVYNETFGE